PAHGDVAAGSETAARSGGPPCRKRRSVECGTPWPGSFPALPGIGRRTDRVAAFLKTVLTRAVGGLAPCSGRVLGPRRAARFEESGSRPAAFEVRGEALAVTTSE